MRSGHSTPLGEPLLPLVHTTAASASASRGVGVMSCALAAVLSTEVRDKRVTLDGGETKGAGLSVITIRNESLQRR